MKKNVQAISIFGTVVAIGIASLMIGATPAKGNLKVGTVSFKTCLEGSKYGRQEQAHFDSIRKEMETSLVAKEKELNELAPKFKDEYLDTLSPEAEAELKNKFKTLSQELSQAQNQYYQMLNQANYQVMQKLGDLMEKAAEEVAKDKDLDAVFNDDACFFARESLDVSADVIKKLDAQFAKDEKTSSDKK